MSEGKGREHISSYIKMRTWKRIFRGLLSRIRIWFRWPEQLVIFTFGLVFCKGLMIYVLNNLMTFLTDFWNLNLKEAAAIVNLQEGLRNMLQICVALCIDAYLGYRWMLILSSVLYSAGLVLLAFSVPEYFFNNGKECPLKDCFKTLRHTPFWEGLALLIVGGASQVIPLYSLSFEQTKVVKAPKDSGPTRVKVACCRFVVKLGGWRQFLQKVIRWLCRGFLIMGIITSVYGFLSFKNNWHQRYLASAIAIVIGLLWFLCGFPFYGRRRLQPSPLLTMMRTVIAALQKRHLNYQEHLGQLHRHDGEDQNQLLTDHLEMLNNAAVKESLADDNLPTGNWRLCSVKEVEQSKLLLDLIPMSATFIVYGMVKSLGNTFFLEQADSTSGDIPIIVLQVIKGVTRNAVKGGYKVVFAKRIQRMQRQYSDGVKIGIGMLTSIICCAVASSVESKRLEALRESGLLNDPKARAPISAAWLLLQFCSLGAMEGLAGSGIADFFGHYVPDSRRYGPVFTDTLAGFGILLNIGFIAMIDYYSRFRYKESWVGDSVNESRLDLIYRAYVILAILNCFLYAYVSSSYSYDNIIGKPEDEPEIPFLEVKQEEETVAYELQSIPVR
ncbi:protein NRT1/ PTR FAMILY 5.5 [Gossypium raimondii]|uniref:Nodulin-like domain-containing protein n=1 Tax=Gossypium raimondii TaxID=29730 RepID=A0A0D2RH54_GOSRA|nr:protein NRT1/ PTR FAMILY 5.5 [Gossypium raimondii]XP_052481018.1 protein NRT1/ PTR FAMILY 5.5 [Gossypium raimondii]KJB50548.1 hypothetical protein B456_008G176000 [Gossypium raimondii]